MTLINGRAYLQRELLNCGTPVLRIQNLNKGNNWYYSNLTLPEDKYCKDGDLLFAWSATFGPYIFSGPKSIYHYHIWKIIPKKNILNKGFAFYMLLNITQKVKDEAHGISMLHITKSKMEAMQIPLPSFSSQQKIAAILDAADEYRQKTKTLIGKYDQLAQSLFLDMFGDPVMNQKGWEKKKLGAITDISSGSTPSRENSTYYIGDNNWVKTTELRGVIINDSLEKISNEALMNTSCRLYPIGTILIAMYGQGVTRGRVGILGIEAATNQACAALPPSNKMNSEYLFNHLKFSYGELRDLGRGGNQPNLNSGLVKMFKVLNPPFSLQNQFAERIQLIESQKQQAQASLQKAEDLFNSLLQKAFKGELVAE